MYKSLTSSESSFWCTYEGIQKQMANNSWTIPIRIGSISVADPDPGSEIRDWVLFDPWIRDPGWEKVSIRIRDPGSGMNNPDHIF
jgi:hypothetical protein